MGAKSQRKGRAAELELARLLQGCGYDVEPGRALNFGEKPDLCGLPGVSVTASPPSSSAGPVSRGRWSCGWRTG